MPPCRQPSRRGQNPEASRILARDSRAQARRSQVTGHRCTICDNEHVSEVDALLGSGSSIRQVARLTGVPRSNLARHKIHLAATSTPFALIRGDGGPDGPADHSRKRSNSPSALGRPESGSGRSSR
jgi:hypothetical protein